jgi:hypothetical protein
MHLGFCTADNEQRQLKCRDKLRIPPHLKLISVPKIQATKVESKVVLPSRHPGVCEDAI